MWHRGRYSTLFLLGILIGYLVASHQPSDWTSESATQNFANSIPP